jgi:hypothetical protein
MMKTKILLWSVVSVLTVGIAGDVSLKAGDTGISDSGSTQAIQLDDGTKLTLLGITHGGNQTAPGYEHLATANRLYTKNGTTVVWIEAEHKPGQWPNYELVVYDPAMTAGVHLEKSTASHVKDGVDFQGFILRAFPRRDRLTILRAKNYNGPVGKGEIIITNEDSSPFENWTPESLPITKSDGDLEVTLTNLIAGMPWPEPSLGYPFGRDPGLTLDDPANRCVRLSFNFRQNGDATTNWFPHLVTTTDATGNRVEGVAQLCIKYPTGSRDFSREFMDRARQALEAKQFYYHPGLWPNEPWKVRLEFIRTSGFSDDEIVTFTNLPVKLGSQRDGNDEWTWEWGKTNFTYVQATVNGFNLELIPPLLVPDQFQPGVTNISVIIGADSNPKRQGMYLTILEATDNQGRELWHPFTPDWAGHYSIDLPRVGDVKTLNLKLALHKNRFVEFTVQPAKR